jgi:BON domain
MNKRLALIAGAGIGAGMMYMLDPDRGGRRRALLRDKAIRLTTEAGCALGKLSRDLGNRAVGAVSEIRASLSEGDIPDSVLVDRVKSRLGRYPVHDRSITVDAHDGVVSLAGDALADEFPTMLSAVSHVRGVKDVVNNLTIHQTADGISSLQGQPAGADAY